MGTMKDLDIPGKRIAQIAALIFIVAIVITSVCTSNDATGSSGWLLWTFTGCYILTICYIIAAILFTGQGKQYTRLIAQLSFSILLFLAIAFMWTSI